MGIEKYSVIPVPGIKVLLVDRDTTCLLILTKMFQILGYQVVVASRAYDAFKIIEERKIHLVIMDLHLSNMGFHNLIEIIEEKYHIPSFVMSASEDHNLMLQALWKGAKLCFKKPLLLSDIHNLWQFALWRRKDGSLPYEHIDAIKDDHERIKQDNKGKEIVQRDAKKKKKEQEKGKGKEVVVVEDKGGEENEPQVKKRQRITWTATLHNKFIEAFDLAGPNATAKKIHHYMNAPGITKQHVSSYLQKYRQTLRQKAADIHQLEDTKPTDSNLGSQSLPQNGLIDVNPMEAHGNPAYFPTMKTEDSDLTQDQLGLPVTLQGPAHGSSSSFNQLNMDAYWDAPPNTLSGANGKTPSELIVLESFTHGSVLNEDALLSGASFLDHTAGKTEMQCSTLPVQLLESNDASAMDYTACKSEMELPTFLPQLLESNNASSMDYTSGKSEMQSSTLPANNDMNLQFPPQLPVQPGPSYEPKFDLRDAEFVDMDEIFNNLMETMEVYDGLDDWLSKI